MHTIETYRNFLKVDILEQWDDIKTDQDTGVTLPPMVKPFPEDADLVDLVKPEDLSIGHVDFLTMINQRQSRRKYTSKSLTLEELSYLLWATQGVKEVTPAYKRTGFATMRTVPSAGARHAFETYLSIHRVEGLAVGLYRYLPIEHKLLFIRDDKELAENLIEASYDQPFIKRSAVCFIWTVIPYRMEWRYHIFSHKNIALDAGHVCQNLYLAAESIGAGTCAIGAYHQKKIDALIEVDGEDEFVIYLAPVGKI